MDKGLEQCDKCDYFISVEEAYNNGRADAIDFIVNSIIFPLLDEYDIGVWEHVEYIPLARAWCEAIRNNIYPHICGCDENCDTKRKEYLSNWIKEKLEEQK